MVYLFEMTRNKAGLILNARYWMRCLALVLETALYIFQSTIERRCFSSFLEDLRDENSLIFDVCIIYKSLLIFFLKGEIIC